MKIPFLIKPFVERIKEDASNRIELLKVKGIRKSSEILTTLSLVILFAILVLSTFFFCGISLSFYISNLVHSYAVGFLLIGLIPFLILLTLLIFKQKIKTKIRNFFVQLIISKEDEE